VHTLTDDYEWDEGKARANLLKHGVDFAQAVDALWDDCGITVPDEHPGEERYVTFGMDALGRLPAVVYTWRGKTVRLISARTATRNEARQYAAGNR
jgi:uncharacterized DUF497 family protein